MTSRQFLLTAALALAPVLLTGQGQGQGQAESQAQGRGVDPASLLKPLIELSGVLVTYANCPSGVTAIPKTLQTRPKSSRL